MTDWFENEALFRQELEKGHKWASLVHEALVRNGLDATLTPLEWRKDIDDRHRFANEGDIRVSARGKQFLIESKSRNLTFTDDPASYPYPTALVDTVSGWDQKADKPRAVVLVSQRTRGMLVIPVNRTRMAWTVKATRDRIRNVEDRWYEVPSSELVPFGYLLEWLRNQAIDSG